MLRDLISRIIKGTKKSVTLPRPFAVGGEFLLRKTDFGLVHVEFAVVKKIAERAVSQIEGIHDVAVEVDKINGTTSPLELRLTVTLAEGYSAPNISREADKAINNALQNSLQPNFYAPIKIRVKQIQPVEPKRRRVR